MTEDSSDEMIKYKYTRMVQLKTNDYMIRSAVK